LGGGKSVFHSFGKGDRGKVSGKGEGKKGEKWGEGEKTGQLFLGALITKREKITNKLKGGTKQGWK